MLASPGSAFAEFTRQLPVAESTGMPDCSRVTRFARAAKVIVLPDRNSGEKDDTGAGGLLRRATSHVDNSRERSASRLGFRTSKLGTKSGRCSLSTVGAGGGGNRRSLANAGCVRSTKRAGY